MVAQRTLTRRPSGLPGYDLPPVPAHGTRVILMRHSDGPHHPNASPDGLVPEGLAPDSGQDSVHPPGQALAPEEEATAAALGRYLTHCPIATVYTSPLERAQQTAAAVLPHLKTPAVKRVTVDPLLRQIHLPGWEGYPPAAVPSQHQDAYRCWHATPDQWQTTVGDIQPRSVYPVRELYARAQQFWTATLPRHRGQTLLVIGHGTSNQALINTALGRSPRQLHTCQQTPSGLTVLDFTHPTARPAHLQVLNATRHPGLPTLQAGPQGLRLLLLPQDGSLPGVDFGPWLRGESIHGAIVADPPLPGTADRSRDASGQRWVQTLLRHHPETVLLSAPEVALGSQWQQAIQRSRSATLSPTLTTVLAIARLPALQACINTLFHLPPTATTFSLKPQHLTVIHYPATPPHPILQGLNLRP